jgi:hypothetical protein
MTRRLVRYSTIALPLIPALASSELTLRRLPCCTVLQLVCLWAYFRGHSFTDESLCRFLCAVAYEQIVRGSRPSVELMGNCGSCPQSIPARHVRAASHPVVGSNRHVDTALQDVISPTVAWELVREDHCFSLVCHKEPSHRNIHIDGRASPDLAPVQGYSRAKTCTPRLPI